MFCVGSHELQRTVANLGQNLSNLPRTHSRGGRKWRGAGTARRRRRRRRKMTVPVEEAVAALSTFSLEVQPFSLVFGFLIGFFVSFVLLLLPLSCFFLHFTKHFPQSTCNQHCRHPIILTTTSCCLLLKSIASRFNLSNFHTGSSFSFSLPFSSSDDVFCICECGSAICKCAHNQPNS
jgi:hypothetical protein